MNYITHQTPEQIIKAATAEQKILWNYIFLKFGDNIAIQQYVFKAGATTEPLNYALGRMFFAYEFYASTDTTTFASLASITFYDEANNTEMALSNGIAWWSGAAAVYAANSIYAKNLIFSRYSLSNYVLPTFWGYRIIYN